MRRRGAIAVLAILAAASGAAGCGGSSGGKSKTTPVPAGARKPPPPRPAGAPAPPGDAGFLSVEIERSSFESLLGGVASGRASSASVKAYARRTMRERGTIGGNAMKLAKKLKLHVTRLGPTTTERNDLRDMLRRPGRAFDVAYLKVEMSLIPGDVARAAEEATRAHNTQVRALAAADAKKYRAELAAARSAAP